MAEVILKVQIVETGVTKTMKFGQTEQCSAVAEQIAKKSGLEYGPDFGLYDPKGKHWLKAEKALRFYNLKQNDTIEYKKTKQIFKIKLIDDSTRTIVLDTTCPISELVAVVGKKVGLKNVDEFALKVEGADNWLNDTQTLGEQVEVGSVLILQKKYFVTDANIDRDDPVQLHLVYIQSRDDVVAGKHPVTVDQAVAFAALQLQIEQGNHTPGVSQVGNLRLICNQSHAGNKSIDPAIVAEWKKLVGMTEVNAKLRYIQAVRALPTYGITLFSVREHVPGSKKPLNIYLGFTRSHVLRMTMDYQILRDKPDYPLEHVKRWANSDTTFTLDFGGHSKEYYTVLTEQGDEIGKLLAGYIDILLKKRRDAGIVLQDDTEEFAELEDVAGLEGITGGRFASSSGGGQKKAADENVDLDKARRNLEKMINEFGQNAMVSNLTPGMQSFREEVLAQAAKMLAALQEMDGAFPPGQAIGRQAMHQAAYNLVQHAEQMLLAAQTAMRSGEDPDGWLGDAARRVADALKDLLQASKDLSLDPNNVQKRERYNDAKTGLEAALANLQAISRGIYDGDAGKLIGDLTKAVDADVEMFIDGAKAKGVGGPQQDALRLAKDHLKDIIKATANTASDPTVKKFILDAIDDVKRANADLMGVSADPELQSLGKTVQDTLDMLLASAHLPSTLAERDQAEFNSAAQALRRDCAQLMGSKGNAQLIDESLNDIKTNLPVFLGKAKAIAITADKNTKDQMLLNAKRVVESTKLLTGLAAQAIQFPDDDALAAKLRAAAEAVAKAVADLVGDSGKQLAYKELVNQAKKAAANTAGLIASSKNSRRHIGNQKIQGNLLEAAQFTSGALGDLLGALQDPYVMATRASIRFDPNGQIEQQGLRPNPRLIDTVDKFGPKAYKLVASSKAAVPSVTNSDVKEDLKFASDMTGASIQDLIKASKAMKDSSGHAGIEAALGRLADLEKIVQGFAMAASNGTIAPHVNPDQAREEAFKNLNGVVRQLAVASKQLPSVTQEDLGESLDILGNAAMQVVTICREIASTTLETSLQTKMAAQIQHMISGIVREAKAAKAASSNPSPALNKELGESSKIVVDSLQGIVNAAKEVISFELAQRASDLSGGMEEIADSELNGVAKQIEAAMQQLLAVSAAARDNQNQMSLDEQNLSTAILQACQNIAGTTGRLIASAGVCQRERGETTDKAVYKDNAAFKEGLLSAAKAVAGSVTYLVTVANDAVQGKAKDTQLRAAAQSVSVANAQLKSAAQAKGDPTRESYTRMAEASADVNKATAQLTLAAKQASAWEEEQLSQKSSTSSHDNKIARYQKQAELEELEAQLRAARGDLMAKRKAAYNPNATGTPASASAPTPSSPKQGPPPGMGGKKMMMKKRPPPGVNSE